MLIYCAGAIDHADHQEWLDDLIGYLTRYDWADDPPVLFMPARAFFIPALPVSARSGRKLINLNERAIRHAQVMIVQYVIGQETWGTPSEVRLATKRHLPIYLHTAFLEGLARVGQSVYLSQAVPADRCFTTWGGLLDRLRQDFYYPPSE